MPKIPHRNIVQEYMESFEVPQYHRATLGMSELGHPCQRYLWYTLHWAYNRTISPRLARIFERGDIEEERIVRDLINRGIKVIDQQLEISDITGHIQGHIDGKLLNVPGAEKTEHLLEAKSMNGGRYKTYIKKGLQESDLGYYVQINQYMGYLGLRRCLFVVTNKNDEERSYVRIPFDENNFLEYKRIGFEILVADKAPNKIGDITWFNCKMCAARGVCHENQPYPKNCRTCQHVVMNNSGKWECSIHTKNLTEDEQRNGCEYHEISEAFS